MSGLDVDNLSAVSGLEWASDFTLTIARAVLAPANAGSVQGVMKEANGEAVGLTGTGVVVVKPARACEGVVIIRVVFEPDCRMGAQSVVNSGLRFRRHELILSRDVEQQGAIKVTGLVEVGVYADAIIADARITIGSAGCQIRQQAAKAVSHGAGFAGAGRIRAESRQRVGDVAHAGLDIEPGKQGEGALQVRIDMIVEFDPGLDAPEEIGAQGDKTGFGKTVADQAHIGVDAEYLLQDQHARPCP